MQPRKFFYRESHYFSHQVLLRGVADGMVGEVVALDGSDLPRSVIFKDVDWAGFCSATEDLEIGQNDYDLLVQDGFEVECHVTFYRTRFNFLVLNPSSQDFLTLRAAINEISTSADCPQGILDMIS